jgi:hypothetical protein
MQDEPLTTGVTSLWLVRFPNKPQLMRGAEVEKLVIGHPKISPYTYDKIVLKVSANLRGWEEYVNILTAEAELPLYTIEVRMAEVGDPERYENTDLMVRCERLSIDDQWIADMVLHAVQKIYMYFEITCAAEVLCIATSEADG